MPPSVAGGKSWNFYNPRDEDVGAGVGGAGGHLQTAGHVSRRPPCVLKARLPRPGAADRLDKLTFTPMESGRVHQYWEQSLDGGKTW